jgi:hypothetical protein
VRPSVTEQLQGLRRILEEVVAPELNDPYPKDILAGVCATLESIAAGWQQVPAFLDWDARASAALAAELEGTEIAVAELGDPLNIAELEARHRESRAALEAAIAGREDVGESRRQVASHFQERAERYPLKTMWRPAGPTKS